MKKVIVGLVLAVTLFVAGSAAAELVYCSGYSQGVIDGYASTWGGPPPGWSPDPIAVACQAAPNDPFGMEPFGVTRFYVGNFFDKIVEQIKDLL